MHGAKLTEGNKAEKRFLLAKFLMNVNSSWGGKKINQLLAPPEKQSFRIIKKARSRYWQEISATGLIFSVDFIVADTSFS